MGDKYISSAHIDKLGHKILEIRERALNNIVSKLDNGVIFDNDLARSKELLNKLFKWFLLEPCTQEEVVFGLMKRILQSKSGTLLINHLGKKTLMDELKKIRSYLEPHYLKHVDEIDSVIKEISTVVPPLESDLPLSYRSDTTNYTRINETNIGIGSTATTIEGIVQKSSSIDQQGYNYSSKAQATATDDRVTYHLENKDLQASYTYANNLPNYLLKWQPLIGPDRYVLESIANSLTNPPQPSALLHSCEFFVNVLLKDFPAEVFLQRPIIIKEFYGLMNCGSNRITNAILNCLLELTSRLYIRIQHCNDPSMKNLKLENMLDMGLGPSTPSSSTNRSSVNNNLSSRDGTEKFESPEETYSLQKRQLSTPQFCYLTTKAIFQYLRARSDTLSNNRVKSNQNAVNVCFLILEELLKLTSVCIKKEIWDQKQTDVSLGVLKYLNESFVLYGDSLDFFRVESITCEKNLKYRAMYLFLVHNCMRLLKELVPLSNAPLILPRNLKMALANALIDVTLSRMYPEVYHMILSYVETFPNENGSDALKKYKEVEAICRGMTSSVKFLNNHQKFSDWENLKLAKEALPSIEFHKNLEFIKVFIDVCSGMIQQEICAQEILLHLLSHTSNDVREETYRLCYHKVILNLGPKANHSTPGDQISFLLTSKILIEIAAFGMTSKNFEIKRFAEDIILYILKCKMIVSEDVWNRVIVALVSSIPIIACHANRSSNLGKTLVSLTDPDNARAILLPEIVMLKCNTQFLFSEDACLREEAFSRICWMLSSQENARELLPKINHLYDTALANIFCLKKTIDVNKLRRTEHFYQPSSVHQVMDVLRSNNVEPVIKRSALNQVSVMMEDPLLHQIFIESDGIEIVTHIMKTSLTESDYRDYPDSIIPIISILKNLCFYHASVREEISLSIEIVHWVLRGIFLFFTEERLRQDATTLLFLMIFKDFMFGSLSKGDLSLPAIVTDKMCMPFHCGTHWTQSPYTQETIKDRISSDRWCLSSIQIQWNCEMFGGFEELVKFTDIDYVNQLSCNIVDILKLSKYDLESVKMSSINFCIGEYLKMIQNGTSHNAVTETIDHLTLYVLLYKVSKMIDQKEDSTVILSQAWEASFSRFINALPSSEDDILLLRKVIKLLALLVPFYITAEKECWIIKFLKDPTQCLLDVIGIDRSSDNDAKAIAQELLCLITVSVRKEQHYLDFYTPCTRDSVDAKEWTHVIKIIVSNLRFTEEQHFFNLAYLDSLLSCLVHLTAALGWSDQKPNMALKPPLPDLMSGLCELLCAFHSGKGSSAAVSVMGLSITRNVLLIMNHVLAEIRHTKAKCWEDNFFGDINHEGILNNILALWASRDVVLRAAALQIFSSLSVFTRAAMEIVNEVKVDETNVWELAFSVINDHHEAPIVRENAVQLLANMGGHMAPMSGKKLSDASVTSFRKSSTMEILNLMEETNFYGNLDILLHSLFTLNVNRNTKCKFTEGLNYILDSASSEKSWNSSSDNMHDGKLVTTPALVKTVANFLLNILNLHPEELSVKLQEHGLVKLLFRTLCDPSMSIQSTKELSLYCDIIEMDTSVCMALNRIASSDYASLGTILHTKDCFNVMMSLLNPKIYFTNLPQLVYLRNRLWSEIFKLLSTLIEYSGGIDGQLTNRSLEAASVFSSTLKELEIKTFFETLCESISCIGSKELQNSALISFSNLLKVETYRVHEESKSSHLSYGSSSLQTLLDSVRTSHSIVLSDTKENIGYRKTSNKTKSTFPAENLKMNLLEQAYFGKVLQNKMTKIIDNDVEVSFIENKEDGILCGAELCKILCYIYDICDVKLNKGMNLSKKKTFVVAALSGLVCISIEAKKYVLESGFSLVVLKQLRDYHIKLSLEPVDCLRRAVNKKRLCPTLNQMNDLINLLNNLMLNYNAAKVEMATLNLADIVHKLWIWFLLQSGHVVDVLKMLSTYTDNCKLACQTLPLTSSVAGSGPKKSPSNVSLLHAIINLINKHMELVSKTHDPSVLEAAFSILQNSCMTLECRIIISKSNLFQSMSRLHPALTKRQKPWEEIEYLWLNFLDTFTMYPEGQTTVVKIPDLLDVIMSLTSSSKPQNKVIAMTLLRNLAFYQPNKSRLLSSGDFLNILSSKLAGGNYEEKKIVIIILWALAANSQRAKIILKSAHLDTKLHNVLKQLHFMESQESHITDEDLNMFNYVLNILTDDRIR